MDTTDTLKLALCVAALALVMAGYWLGKYRGNQERGTEENGWEDEAKFWRRLHEEDRQRADAPRAAEQQGGEHG